MINLEGALQQEDRFTDWLVHASKAVIIKYMCLLNVTNHSFFTGLAEMCTEHKTLRKQHVFI